MLKINRDHRARLVSSNQESFAYTNSNTILLLYAGDIRVWAGTLRGQQGCQPLEIKILETVSFALPPPPPPPQKISTTKGPNYKGLHGTHLPTPKDKKGEILNLELEKVVRNW